MIIASVYKLKFLGIIAEIEQIIRFLHWGKIFLSHLNVREILQSADSDYFGINILVTKCIEFYTVYTNLDMDYNLALKIRNVWRTGVVVTKNVAQKSEPLLEGWFFFKE